MSAYLVAAGRNLADNLRMLLGYVTQNKKSCASPRFFEKPQQPAAGLDNAVLIARPMSVRNLKALVPIFKINSQGISDRFHFVTQSMNS